MMENIQKARTKYWGYDGFLPLQKQAMKCISHSTDSIVVLPTAAPGLEFADFEIASKVRLLEQYPDQKELIRELSRK